MTEGIPPREGYHTEPTRLWGGLRCLRGSLQCVWIAILKPQIQTRDLFGQSVILLPRRTQVSSPSSGTRPTPAVSSPRRGQGVSPPRKAARFSRLAPAPAACVRHITNPAGMHGYKYQARAAVYSNTFVNRARTRTHNAQVVHRRSLRGQPTWTSWHRHASHPTRRRVQWQEGGFSARP